MMTTIAVTYSGRSLLSSIFASGCGIMDNAFSTLPEMSGKVLQRSPGLGLLFTFEINTLLHIVGIGKPFIIRHGYQLLFE